MRLARWHRTMNLFRQRLWFDEGLFGFEELKEYTFEGRRQNVPYFKLMSVSNPRVHLVTVDPFVLFPQFEPKVCRHDILSLGSKGDDLLFLLAVVNTKTKQVNLSAPLLIDWRNKKGRQVVLNY